MEVLKIVLIVIGCTLQHRVLGSGVSTCYLCNGNCNEPLQEVSCGSSTNTTNDLVCISATQGNFTVKGCVSNDSTSIEACKEINQRPDGYCYLCNTDLCNRRNKIEGATKCYSCLGDCQPPYRTEECPESNDVTYVCRTSQITISNDDVIYERRGCAADTQNVNDICNNIEKSDVGSCYTCPDDLCNNFLDTRVSQCYSCEGYCDSLIEENCPDDGQNYMCMTFKDNIGSTTVEKRGCYLAYADTMDGCSKSNDLKNGSCYTCFSDLCNTA